MTLKFCGAARGVTGSAHLITLDDGFRILLDCGMFQGSAEREKMNRDWLFDPASVDCVILSHAHIDHSGRLPKLVKDGFQGPIYSTHATQSLCAIMLLDSAKIQEKDAEYLEKLAIKNQRSIDGEAPEPLYTAADVAKTMDAFVTYGYERWFRVHSSVEVMFRDAGHILGSASVTLRVREGEREIRFGFTGDIGRPRRPILRDPQPMPKADFLICESTYGDREHLGSAEESGALLEIIRHTCGEKKGKLIIPSFSVGRTQELIHILDRLETANRLPHYPVYIDSPLAINATAIFEAHPECYDDHMNEYILIDKDPFKFNNLIYVRDVELSKMLNTSDEPCIIISSSGMMNAGRVVHHLYHNIDHPRNTFLFVGYCSPETPCGQLRAGVETISVFGEKKPVKAEIKILDSFSAHADRKEMLAFLSNQKQQARRIWLVHGDLERQNRFRDYLLAEGFKDVVSPKLGETFSL
jgi:metallo-beta-lactamase family protein